MVETPSQLARALVNDICKTQLKGCKCCPAIVSALWKRQLSSQIRAGIAHCQLTAESFNEVVQLADDIHNSSRPAGSVAAIAAVSMDETLPALQSSVVPEIAATSRGGRGGRGRGGRGRGRGRGRGGGGQSEPEQARPRSGTKHPDLPQGEWKGCNMHYRWGKSAFFCSEPSTCPWKNIYVQKPAKQ